MTKVSFTVDGRIFDIEAILKTVYLFSNDYYVDVKHTNRKNINIVIESKEDVIDENIIKNFKNELLAQTVRYKIAESNKDVRELVIGRALYSSCITTASQETEPPKDIKGLNLDDIAVDWFEAK